MLTRADVQVAHASEFSFVPGMLVRPPKEPVTDPVVESVSQRDQIPIEVEIDRQSRQVPVEGESNATNGHASSLWPHECATTGAFGTEDVAPTPSMVDRCIRGVDMAWEEIAQFSGTKRKTASTNSSDSVS